MSDPLTILAIDPSSTCTGYAAVCGAALLEAGVLRPKASADANARIRAIAADFTALLGEVRPHVVVIEDTCGKVARRLGQNVSGLAVYGKAVGRVIGEAERWASASPGRSVELVKENEWTGGKAKAVRAARVAAEYPQYDRAKDPGMDAADAIALATYWQSTLQTRRAFEAALRK